MTPEIFALCVLGAVLELDTTYAFQLTFSRGIIAAPLMALLTGDIMTGIQIGVFVELLFSDINPLGGIIPPSAAVCCAAALGIYAFGVEIYFAFFAAVLCALGYSFVEHFMRKTRFKWLVFWEQKIELDPSVVARPVMLALASSFLVTFVYLVLCVSSFGYFLHWLEPHIPQQAHAACKFAYVAVPWIGFATLISSFRLKTR